MSENNEYRIPPEVNGIQVNFCKNPVCPNFGKPASQEKQPRGRYSQDKERDSYKVVGSGRKVPMLECKECGEYPTLKSNLGISEEIERISKYLTSHRAQTCCPNPECGNKKQHIFSGHYLRYPNTKAGNMRFRCRDCGKTFTVVEPSNPIARQTVHSSKNKSIFKDLVNKTPFRGIASKHEISMKTVYDKIDFLHRQCVAFACHYERNFSNLELGELFIAVDRQDYRLNWVDTNDKRNVVLHGLASAECASGFIFGIHLDYDSGMDAESVEKEAWATKDHEQKPPFRKFARLWLEADAPYSVAKHKDDKELETEREKILKKVEGHYEETVTRPDVEVAPENNPSRKRPREGMLVHSEYTLYAHFFFLKKLLQGAEKIVFYMDQESGIRSACHSAFWEDILSKRVEGFYVKITKDLTIHEKDRLIAEVKKEFGAYLDAHPWMTQLSTPSVKILAIEQLLNQRTSIGPWKDEWLEYPFPDQSEPKKAVCWLTDLDDDYYSNDELARLFYHANLHSVDRFFMQLRRKTSLLERPISTASSGRRTWLAYDPYNPAVVAKLVEIYRVYYNYIKTGEDKETPAMRLGITKAPKRFEDIIYFKEQGHSIFK